ncbi:hypothetical protein BH23GEM2_BH23GEM2_25890 [soil metagenome]
MKSKRAEKVQHAPKISPPVASATPASEPGNGSRGPRSADAGTASKRAAGWRPKENILEIAAASGRFETLGRAVKAAGFTEMLSAAGPITLFAPTDKAFLKLPPAELSALLADKAKLQKLLSHHVVPSKVRAPRSQVPSSVTTHGGEQIEIRVVPEDGGYAVSDARIVKTNIRASNGVIHAIDTILTPR